MLDINKFPIVLMIFFLGLTACGGSKEKEVEYYNRAKAHFDSKNYDKTRVELTNVLQINPKNIDARYLLAMLAEKDENWRKMYGLLLGVVEKKPDFIEAQTKLGTLYLLSGQFEKALKVVDFVLAKEGKNTDALILQAAVYMRKGELVKSEAVLKDVLTSNPAHVEATLILAKQYADNKQFSAAISLINKALLVNPDEQSLALSKINNLVSVKSFKDAEVIFLGLIAKFPEKPAFRYNLAKFYIAWEKVDQGEKVLREYIAFKPNETEPKLMLAEYLLQKKGVKEAEQSLQQFIRDNTENYDLRFALAKVYQDTPEQAITVLEEIVATDEQGIISLKANNLLAMFAVKQGDKKQAYQLLDEIITKDTRNSGALMLRSSLLVDDGQLEAAIADLRVVMRDNPDSEDAFVLSSNAHIKSGFFDLAEDSLEKVIALNPNNIEGRKNLARLLVRNNDIHGAIKILESATDINNQHDVVVLSMLIDLYIKTSAWDKAFELAQTIPKNKTGLTATKLGKIYFAQKKYDSAVNEYLKVLALNPLDINSLTQLSNSYIALDEPKKAEILLAKVSAKHPENTAVLNLNGILQRKLKHFDKARSVFEKSIALDKTFIPGYNGLASIHVINKEYSNAITTFKQGLKIQSKEVALLIGLANVYERSQDLDSAIETYISLLGVDQNNKIAANNLAVLITKTSNDSERLKYALSLVKKFKQSKIPELLDTYGWLNYLNGDYKEALIALEKVVALVPDFPEFEYHLGMIYAENGRTEEAKAALEKASSEGADYIGIDKAKKKLVELTS